MKTLRPAISAGPARYTMSPQDERASVELVRRAGEQLDDGHWLITGGTKSIAGQLGRMLERRVFDHDYGDHTSEVMEAEYRAFEQRSIHVVIVDNEGPAAAGRIIWSPSMDHPTKLESDLGFQDGRLREYHKSEERFGTAQFSEKATVVVEPRHRGSVVTGWLIGEIGHQQMQLDEQAPCCAMVDVRLRRMLGSWGAEFEPAMGLEPFEYFMQICQPVFFPPGVQPRVCDSRMYRDMTRGYRERILRPVRSSPYVADIRESLATSVGGTS